MAEQIEMSIDEHDRLMAYVLGLSHALNLAFFTALADSGEAVPRLQRMSSTTFDAQLKVASLVATDNPHLYFEIQALNDYGGASIGGSACRGGPHSATRAERRRAGLRGSDGRRSPLSRRSSVNGVRSPSRSQTGGRLLERLGGCERIRWSWTSSTLRVSARTSGSS